MNIAPRTENLALLYQGLLTGIARIRAGRQGLVDADMFRRRTREALVDIAREAIKRNYAAEHTMETDFAVVALLDESILNSQDPCRNTWMQRPLAEELFDVRIAGELFFTRIEKLIARADSPELADMLEVYYLCILLGFEGQLTGKRFKSDLQLLMDRVRQRIERMRGNDHRFSPGGWLPEETIAVAAPDQLARKLTLAAAAIAGAAILIFIVAWVHLFWTSSQLQNLLLNSRLL